jgi:GT2 family glycosyltransferase
MKSTIRIAVLLTCHNRRELTLACLERLYRQELPPGVGLEVTLVDDGSSDGTGDAVRARFPGTDVIRGDGKLFWCGGMRVAWAQAARKDPEYYLLLNDDTILEQDALAELLLIIVGPHTRRIAIAAIQSPVSGEISYGGGIRGIGKVRPNGCLIECETFNANCVLISRAVYREIGIFHSAYTHAMGDTDYGLQASRRGIKLLQSARFLGSCPNNPISGTWRDRTLSRRLRWKALQSPKGLPFREWCTFNRRNSGWKWIYHSISPIIRILLKM